MSATSIWTKATSVILQVCTSTSKDFATGLDAAQLWAGPLALGGSVSFPDQAGWGGATLTLAVDATGLVSLTSDLDLSGGAGRKFLVMVAPSDIDLTTCQWAQMSSVPAQWTALYVDSIFVPRADSDTGAWPDPMPVMPDIQAGFGFAAGWKGA